MNKVRPLRSPAEGASERALAQVFACIQSGQNFVLEAGAGAGKTYSLVKALQFLVDRLRNTLPKRHQKIACITFTNVAKDEIEARTDRDPLIYCDTIHGFCWSLISGFQKQILASLQQLPNWAEKVAEAGGLGTRKVEYTLGHRSVKDDRVSIHHDDVLSLSIDLLQQEKFRRIVTEKYPVILIDEYQDTDAAFINAVKMHFLGQPDSPLFGLFGDHWQKIYGTGCGNVEHPNLVRIGKEANFRSVSTVVDCLNRMRPDLPQFVKNPDERGVIHVFHTNNWKGERQKGGHWGGDLPSDVSHGSLKLVQEQLIARGWDLSPANTKILMLTHRVLASEQGYASLPEVFRYGEAYTMKEHGHIAYFVDNLEPACEFFTARKFGAMFEALGRNVPAIRSHADKVKWAESMERLMALRITGTVGEVIEHLRTQQLPRVPESVEKTERELERFRQDPGEEMPPALSELLALHSVSYQEIIALARYHASHSPFETMHGVKGAEFENVIVVVGRGWNYYNFNEMLELAQDPRNVPAKRRDAFERARNLFYVACSRPKQRLALLFTQELSGTALRTVESWFGADSVEALEI